MRSEITPLCSDVGVFRCYRAVRSEIDSSVCRAEHYLGSYVSVQKYKQMKIATELHRPTWVSLPLVDAILRDDVLISFITPPEFQTEPLKLHLCIQLQTERR